LTSLAFVGSLTASLGAVIAILAAARMLDARFLRNLRWPGPIASGTPRQRGQVVGMIPLGIGFAMLGAGQAAGSAHRGLAEALLLTALVAFAAAMALFARSFRLPA